MRTRQRLVRTLITEIIVDIDEAAGRSCSSTTGRVGQHSELRVHSRDRRARVYHDRAALAVIAAWQADGPIRTSPRP